MITRYLSIMAALDGAILGGEMISRSSLKAGFFNPPLGAADNLALPVLIAVGMCLTILAPLRITKKLHLRRLSYLAVAIIILSTAGYGWSMQRYGREIDIPARDISDFVIAGTERTPFALENFSSDSDVTMLEKRGWDEDAIGLYWTRHSTNRSRNIVMLTFAGSLIAFSFLVSSTAIRFCRATTRHNVKPKHA